MLNHQMVNKTFFFLMLKVEYDLETQGKAKLLREAIRKPQWKEEKSASSTPLGCLHFSCPHTVLSAWLRLEKVQLCNPEPTTLADRPVGSAQSLDQQNGLTS